MIMKKKYYIGLDQGTTGTTTLLLDETWNVVARGYKEHTQYYPKPGWVEHDPLELWQRVMESMSMALSEGGVSAEDVACIGIDNQGETVMLWDKITGAPVYNAIVWQDRRMARYADELTTEYGELIREKTGLMADSYFSGPKIKWIIDNVDGVKEKIKEGRVLAGTLDSWLIWKMTHGKVLYLIHISGKENGVISDQPGCIRQYSRWNPSGRDVHGPGGCTGCVFFL